MPGTAVPNDVAVRGWHAVRAGIGGGGEWGWQVTGGRIGDEAVGKEIGVGRGGGEPFFEGGGVEAIFAEDDGELDAGLELDSVDDLVEVHAHFRKADGLAVGEHGEDGAEDEGADLADFEAPGGGAGEAGLEDGGTGDGVAAQIGGMEAQDDGEVWVDEKEMGDAVLGAQGIEEGGPVGEERLGVGGLQGAKEAWIGADGGEGVFEAAGQEAKAAEEVGEDGILEGLDAGMDVGLVVDPKEQARTADEEGEENGEGWEEAAKDGPRGRIAGGGRCVVAGGTHDEWVPIIVPKRRTSKGKGAGAKERGAFLNY